MLKMDTKSPALEPLWMVPLVFGGALLFAFLLYPRTGVGDIDAFTYIIGTHAIHAGLGYGDLHGNAITTWPPGYSYLLSVFPFKPLVTATIINNIAFAIATALLYHLARLNQWNRPYALALAVIVGAGFYRSIAFFAKPDILTFALFLIGLYFYWYHPSSRTRWIPFTLWNLLIPIKLVTAVITPAALLSELISDWRVHRRLVNLRSYLYPAVSWGVSLGGLLLYNRWVSDNAMPSSHASASLLGFLQEIVDFFVSIPRTSLAFWYGTLRDPIALVLFGACLGLGIVVLLTLRPDTHERQKWYFGIALILLTFTLLAVRKFDAQMRTVGYGVLVLLLLWRPLTRSWSRPLWLGYATLMLIAAIGNVLLVNAQGANHPMYEVVVNEFLPALNDRTTRTLYSNAYHITDIHAGIPSTSSTTLPDTTNDSYFLHITLPNVDGIMTTVLPPPSIEEQWCVVKSINAGVLYEPCAVNE